VIRLGVVMGLQAEAGCLGPAPEDGIVTYVSGGSALRARTGAEQLRAKGIDGLVSFGLAIGLAPVLRPGDLVVGEGVVLPAGGTIATDPDWRAAVLRRLGAAGLKPRSARVLGGDEPLTSASAKRRAFQATLAAALDTESHAVAQVAAEAGLPLLVLRAVAEPAESMRPAIAFAATTAAGEPRRLAMVARLIRRPWEIGAAWQYSKDRRLALDALRRAATIGPAAFSWSTLEPQGL
jgi:adenosylhomocysteine nucleosidase